MLLDAPERAAFGYFDRQSDRIGGMPRQLAARRPDQHRRRRVCSFRISDRRRAGLDDAGRGACAQSRRAALFCRQRSERRCRRDRLQRLLLSFPRPLYRQARLALGVVDGGHSAADRRRADGPAILRVGRRRRIGAARARRPAVPAHRLALVAERRRDDHAGWKPEYGFLHYGGKATRGDRTVRVGTRLPSHPIENADYLA